jgi:hypothetical protein
MFKRNCVVKYVDSFGVEHAAKVEAESLFEAAVRGLHRLDPSFWAEDDVFDRMCVTVEVHEEPTTHTVMIEKLKRWLKSQGRHPREEAKKEELRNSCLGRIESDPTLVAVFILAGLQTCFNSITRFFLGIANYS